MLIYQPLATAVRRGGMELDQAIPKASLRLAIRNLGDISVFQCAGRIALGDEDLLRNAIHSRSLGSTIVLDLAQVNAVDAAGLGMLVALREWAGGTGKSLKLINVTPHVEEMLELTGLISFFEVCSFREMMTLWCRGIRSQFDAVGASATVGPPELARRPA